MPYFFRGFAKFKHFFPLPERFLEIPHNFSLEEIIASIEMVFKENNYLLRLAKAGYILGGAFGKKGESKRPFLELLVKLNNHFLL
jgi:hypothetical protein